jgi:hypothetical protein
MDLQDLVKSVQECQTSQGKEGEISNEVGKAFVSAVLTFTEVSTPRNHV